MLRCLSNLLRFWSNNLCLCIVFLGLCEFFVGLCLGCRGVVWSDRALYCLLGLCIIFWGFPSLPLPPPRAPLRTVDRAEHEWRCLAFAQQQIMLKHMTWRFEIQFLLLSSTTGFVDEGGPDMFLLSRHAHTCIRWTEKQTKSRWRRISVLPYTHIHMLYTYIYNVT